MSVPSLQENAPTLKIHDRNVDCIFIQFIQCFFLRTVSSPEKIFDDWFDIGGCDLFVRNTCCRCSLVSSGSSFATCCNIPLFLKICFSPISLTKTLHSTRWKECGHAGATPHCCFAFIRCPNTISLL